MGEPRTPEGMVLFEVYEANGALLYVGSTFDRESMEPGDYVLRRPWATAAHPEPVRSRHANPDPDAALRAGLAGWGVEE